MIKNTIILLLIVIILYSAKASFIVAMVDNFPYYWNYATIELLTFSDRHPYIFMAMPGMCVILILSMRQVDAQL